MQLKTQPSIPTRTRLPAAAWAGLLRLGPVSVLLFNHFQWFDELTTGVWKTQSGKPAVLSAGGAVLGLRGILEFKGQGRGRVKEAGSEFSTSNQFGR